MSVRDGESHDRTALDTVLDALRVHHCAPAGNQSGNWHCPAHDDKTPSLSVGYSKGTVLLHCFAECEVTSIVEAIGLEMSDLYDSVARHSLAQSPSPVVARPDHQSETKYAYTDEAGQLVATKLRFEPGEDGRSKSFRWQGGNPHLLYRLPAVLEAEHVHVNEGEKAADALCEVLPPGHVATCPPTSRWEDSYTNSLKGKSVTLWVDRDEAGLKRAARAYTELVAAKISVTVVQSATVDEKSDAFDHVKAGFRIEDAVQLSPSKLSGVHDFLDPEAQPAVDRFSFLALHEFEYRLNSRGLIKGVIDRGGFVVTYGASNSSKTFLVLYMALCVAVGRACFGRKVRQQLVVYVATEGGGSIANRIAALREHYLAHERDVPFYVLPVPINLLDQEGDIGPMITAIRKLEDEAGQSCGFVIIDTLSQSMPGGDENGPKDMTTAVDAVNRIRRELGAAVNLVHHTGKNDAAGARGHSSLRAATDTELEVSAIGGGYFQMRPTKQRDYAQSEPLHYRLHVMEIGLDEDGDMQTTCVVEPVERAVASAKKRRGKLDRRARILQRCMEELLTSGNGQSLPDEVKDARGSELLASQLALSIDDVRPLFYERFEEDGEERDSLRRSSSDPTALKRQALMKAKKTLTSAGTIEVSGNWLWFRCP